MNCTYYRPTSHNLREWENIRGKMRYDLSLLEKEPVNEVGLRCYLEALLPQAEQLEGAPGMRFFALGDPNSLPADCRVEYVYWPTYIAAAFCMKALLLCPDVISMIGEDMAPINGDDALRILSECLRGCTGRGFSGHGFDDIRGLVDTMDFFTEHGVQDFLAQYDRDNPRIKYIAEPKECEDRILVMPPTAEAILREQLTYVDDLRLHAGNAWIERGLLFPGPNGDFLSRQTVYDCL